MEEVSKLDAARRQLCTAISLHFDNGDEVSIHTLAHAAFTIIKDLCDNDSTGEDSITNKILSEVHSLKLKCIWKELINRRANFFKHADEDPDDVISLDAEHTYLLLTLAIDGYHRLASEVPIEMEAFRLWAMLACPEYFPESDIPARLRGVNHHDRMRFFRLYKRSGKT